MINKSGLKPLGRAILIKPYDPEVKSSVIAIPETVKDRMDVAEQRAVVVDVGATAWHDEPEPRAKPGDRVLVTKYAGFLAIGTLDGQTYRFINDRDVFGGIVSEKETGNG